MILLTLYLVTLYGVTTLLLLPERLPETIIPYVAIFSWYLVSSGLLMLDHFHGEGSSYELKFLQGSDLLKLALLLLGATIFFSSFKIFTYPVLIVFFISFMVIGAILFSITVISLVKDRLRN